MTSRSLVQKTLNFDSPERVPRQMWLLPWAEMKYPEYSAKIRKAYPDDIIQCPALYRESIKLTGNKFQKGIYIDEWGCTFHNPEDGAMGIVPHPLIKNWADLKNLTPPESFLKPDEKAINKFCNSTEQFVYSGSIIRPYERFQFIRTMEQSFMDVLLEEEGYLELLRIIHSHFLKEVEAWAKTDIDAIFLMDDWGTQHSMMVSPTVFHTHFKPMYKEYCEIARHYGKYIFMHSDGYITDIIDDLIEVGVHALNAQIFCMDMDQLSDRFKGRLTFWGEIDRQDLLPNGSAEEIEHAVHLVHDKLWQNGGLIAQCEFGLGAKPENVEKVFESWDKVII